MQREAHGMGQGRRRTTPGRQLVGLLVAAGTLAGGGWAAVAGIAGSGLSVMARSGLLVFLGCVLLGAVLLLPVLVVEAFGEWRTHRLLEAVADHDDDSPWLAEIYRHLDRAA